ncbi:hypothetical protein OHA70_05360 [Kribbella sp. NBC_00382]|uniref:hypothetical protein n=1 Tax=Kribbella sp. NBC_00382 TaxID=2975967 RepID=UPI002E1DA365
MDTYAVYTSEMAATERLIKNAGYSGATARALTGVLAEQAQMAGWARSMLDDSLTRGGTTGSPPSTTAGVRDVQRVVVALPGPPPLTNLN